ncbi:hypothetical protein D3C71_1822650 [compost metagenome]
MAKGLLRTWRFEFAFYVVARRAPQDPGNNQRRCLGLVGRAAGIAGWRGAHRVAGVVDAESVSPSIAATFPTAGQ